MPLDEVDGAFRQSPLILELVETFESGDFDRFDSSAKRQHFIPRFLLSGFAVGARANALQQLDVDTGLSVQVGTSEAASRRYFYALLDEEGNRTNRIEGFLARVESHAAEARRRLLDQPGAFKAPDRATLSLFFALQDARTPVATERASDASKTIVPLLLAEEFSDNERFAIAYIELFGEATQVEIEEFRQKTLDELRAGSITFSDPKAQALDAGLGTAGQLAYLIYSLDWRLLTCEDAFVTSDRGLAMADPGSPYPFVAQSWASSPESETTIPLSSSACLLIRPLANPGLDLQEIDARWARAINLRTYGWADGYIFGKSEDLVRAVHDEAVAHPEDVERPRVRSQVLLLEADPADRSLAEANEARGWPPYITHVGEQHDYVVVPHGENPLEIAAELDRKVEERVRRKLGVPEGQPLPGRVVTDLVDPSTLD